MTCIKWIPGSPNQFIVSHSSGQMYVYNEELPCGPTPPHYQPFKQGEGFSVFTCKTKSTRNPLYRWMVGHGPINEFQFSPCSQYLAVVGQDGFLRVFNYNSMELIGSMKSYFGGLLCVCWSPDSKFIVVGGEDDLVTVWSFHEKRVVCRGQGHRSWIGVVAFDPYTSVFSEEDCEPSEKQCEFSSGTSKHETVVNGNIQSNRNSLEYQSSSNITTYRFGSVGQDTMLCLWDITEDIIKQPFGRSRTSILVTPNSSSTLPRCNSLPQSQKSNSVVSDLSLDGNAHPIANHTSNLSTKFATLTLAERKESQEKKEHKRNFSLASRNVDKNSILRSNHMKPVDDSMKLLGTSACPRLEDVPILEPLVCKRIASERLTELIFREECIVTACQEGLVYTWARPGFAVSTKQFF